MWKIADLTKKLNEDFCVSIKTTTKNSNISYYTKEREKLSFLSCIFIFKFITWVETGNVAAGEALQQHLSVYTEFMFSKKKKGVKQKGLLQ